MAAPAFALVWFLATVAVLAIAGEAIYPASTAAWCGIVAVGGWGITHYRSRFHNEITTLAGMSSLREESVEHRNGVVNRWAALLFDVRSPVRLAAAAVTYAVWVVTIGRLSEPFEAGWLNAAQVVFFAPMAMVGSAGAVIIIGAILFANHLSRSGLYAPFSIAKPDVMQRVENGWVTGGVASLVVWILFYVAVEFGPHNVNDELAIWLGVMGTFPLIWFIVGAAQIRHMLLSFKTANLLIARRKTDQLSAALTDGSSTIQLAELNTAIEIQQRVLSMREWPTLFSGVSAFTIALVPFTIQIVASTTGLLNSP